MPKISEKIGEKSALENRTFSGLIRAFPRPIGTFSGPIGTSSSAQPPQPQSEGIESVAAIGEFMGPDLELLEEAARRTPVAWPSTELWAGLLQRPVLDWLQCDSRAQ